MTNEEKLNKIVLIVEKFTGVKDLKIKTRKREIVEARQTAHFFAKKYTKYTINMD
jgi:chromosomal replication initiation ATPase DnaA